MGEEEARRVKRRRLVAVKSALREFAAGDFITRVVRGAMARHAKRKMRIKLSAFLRGFSSDETGFAIDKIVGFQRRVRLWLAHNELFHILYEEHRHALLMERTRGLHEALEADLVSREPPLAEEHAACARAVDEKRAAVDSALGAMLRLRKTQGELNGLLR